MSKRSLHPILVLLIAVVGGATTLPAATRYVSTSGNNANNGSQGAPWATIQFALTNRISATVVSNDVVRVQAGIYSERATWTNHGVTVIADGFVQVRGGFLLQSAHHFKLLGDGMVTHSNAPGTYNYEAVRIEDSDGGLIDGWRVQYTDQNCLTLRSGTDNFKMRRFELSHAYWPNFPWLTAGSGGSLVFIGGGSSGTNILFESGWMHDSDDYVAGGLAAEIWIALRNMLFDPVPSDSGGHIDIMQPNNAWVHMLQERNFNKSTYSSDHHAQGHFEPPPQSHLVIRGVVNLSFGGIGLFDTDNLAYYHNTTHSNTFPNAVPPRENDAVVYCDNDSIGNGAFNNIFSYCTKPGNQPIDIGDGSFVERDYNLSFGQAAMNSGTHNVASNPLFINATTNAFNGRLQAGSPARNAAGPISIANGAGVSTTALVVTNAYRWWPGDSITISGASNQITAINSITSITLASAMSWTNAAPILWEGQTDLGALPYGSVELTAATYSVNGSTYTCAPVGDARQVIFYQDGIPHTVDTNAPFAATISSGSVDVIAFAKYAQETNLWVVAAQQGGGEPVSGTPHRKRAALKVRTR